MKRIHIATISLALASLIKIGCNSPVDKATQVPTPEPVAGATPIAKLEPKRDADLESQIAKIAEEAKGNVGVAAVVLETGDVALLNADDRFPMQSVYKLPIAMAVMEQVRLGKLDLEKKITVTPDDFVRKGMRSPLRDENPKGGEFTIRELIRLSIVESDGTASDVQMRVIGGAAEIQNYLTQIGVADIKIVNTEKEIGRDWETQYENWATPIAAVDLLRSIRPWRNDLRLEEKEMWLLRFMKDSVPGEKRLKALLPKGTIVAHKTGTGGTQNGVTGATNDIGIIYLPNGNHLAIAVFVSDSRADEKTREAVIAKIAKAVWDRWSN